jgi:hypothetical protein
MLIAEDLLLLLTEDRTGKLLASSMQVDVALGGALLIELALMGRVEVAQRATDARTGRLVVGDRSPVSDELLDEALTLLGESEGKKAGDVVRKLGKGVRGRLYARLTAQGVLHEERGKILGVLPVHHWPTDDAAHEERVRELLTHALRIGAVDDERTGALVALLHALKAVAKVVDAGAGISKRELNANAKRIAEGNWGAQAVRQAIDALIAATASGAIVASGGG